MLAACLLQSLCVVRETRPLEDHVIWVSGAPISGIALAGRLSERANTTQEHINKATESESDRSEAAEVALLSTETAAP